MLRSVPRSCLDLSALSSLLLSLICSPACHGSQGPAADPVVQQAEPLTATTGTSSEPAHSTGHTASAVDAHTQPVAAAPLAASCGAQAQGSCCGAQSEGSCGCGQQAGAEHGEDHAASCGRQAEPTQAPQTADALASLTRVDDPSQICMVRNHFMGRPQLAVQADGGTYYGCCAGCANRLLQDPRARQAVDPVSHNPVDKALAVLAKTPRGRVLYFENETNLELFRAAMR